MPNNQASWDFEDSDTIPSEWTTSVNNGTTPVVSSEQGFESTNSVKFAVPGGGYRRSFLSFDPSQISGLGDTVHGRMMMYITGSADDGDFTFVQAEGDAKTTSNAPANTTVQYRGRVNGRMGNNQGDGYDYFFANYDTFVNGPNPAPAYSTDCYTNPTASSTSPATEYRVARNEWICLEWYFDASTNQLTFQRDGTNLTQINVNNTGDGCVGGVNGEEGNTWTGPQQFKNLLIGLEQYHGDANAQTLYIDDVVLDTMGPIGCPAPAAP